MTPDEQRSAYRRKCTFARKGHTIFAVVDGKCTNEVVQTFIRATVKDGKKVRVPAINSAKRWVSLKPAGTVFVER